MTRKIIQIATSDAHWILALADDWTLWFRSHPDKYNRGSDVYWYQSPNIPQE